MLWQVSDVKCVFLWGFKIAFGGQRSTGFGVIYDSVDLAKKSLSKHLLMREGLKEKPKGKLARKAGKERKKKVLKVRGKAKAEVRSGKAAAKKGK
jgi:small subunit ribosomal protein S24e